MMAMILTYCSPFDAFVTFTNFVHSNHFLPFFKGIESEVSPASDRLKYGLCILMRNLDKECLSCKTTSGL